MVRFATTLDAAISGIVLKALVRRPLVQTSATTEATALRDMDVVRSFALGAGKDLRDTEARIAEFSEHRVEQEDHIRHLDIRAPESGTVLQLSVHTVGGVVAAGETLMLIVPDESALSVDARVFPTDIDKVKIGKRVALRFTAFDQRSTPELEATIERVAADVQADPQKALSFYAIRIAIDANALKQSHDLKLIAGMPAEAFIDTGNRTVASYLLKPLED